jgi:hypothetical protein
LAALLPFFCYGEANPATVTTMAMAPPSTAMAAWPQMPTDITIEIINIVINNPGMDMKGLEQMMEDKSDAKELQKCKKLEVRCLDTVMLSFTH